MYKFLVSFVLAVILASATLPSAEARTKKQKYTPQQLHDFMCQESDLSGHKETAETWAQYQKDCAVRPASLEKFRNVLAEYLKPQYPKHDKKDDTDYELYRVIDDLLVRTYLSLYELERQKVFADKGTAEQIQKLLTPRGCRKNKNGLRSTFARCYIHAHDVGVDTDGGDERVISSYVDSLKKRGLWMEE